MDKWSAVPIIVVVAFGLILWYISEPIVGHHLGDISSFVKLRLYQWYENVNESGSRNGVESWLAESLMPYIMPHILGNDAAAAADEGGNAFGDDLREKAGPRHDVVYGNSSRNVTITFYIQQGNERHVEDIMQSLIRYNVPGAVFFLDREFASKHPILAETIRQLGYTVKPWTNTSEYDSNYPPTTFNNIALTDREILGHTSKLSDAVTFLDNGIHYWNASVVAFTPRDPPRFQYSDTLLNSMLQISEDSIFFTDSNKTVAQNVLLPSYPRKTSMNLTDPVYHTLATDFDQRTDPANDIVIANGSWTLDTLSKGYPGAVVKMTPEEEKHVFAKTNDHAGGAFLVDKTIIIARDAQLHINNEILLINSSSEDVIPRRIDAIGGKVDVVDSTVTSWDPERKAPDTNAYHPRPYLVARDGGKLDITSSSITHLGFPLGGLADTAFARAALEYRHTGNFTIANATIAHNYYGFYTTDASDFKIVGSNIHSNTRYGLDPHTGSVDFIVDSNYIHDNGNQGIICSKFCKNVTISNNRVEHNVEGIGLHWLTNSSIVHDNIVENNTKYGIYIDKQCYGNTVQDNTVTGNRNGVGILDRSHNNTVQRNVFSDNFYEPVVVDESSSSNTIMNNTGG